MFLCTSTIILDGVFSNLNIFDKKLGTVSHEMSYFACKFRMKDFAKMRPFFCEIRRKIINIFFLQKTRESWPTDTYFTLLFFTFSNFFCFYNFRHWIWHLNLRHILEAILRNGSKISISHELFRKKHFAKLWSLFFMQIFTTNPTYLKYRALEAI